MATEMFQVDDSELQVFSQELKLKRPSQVAAITRSVLNDEAFAVQPYAKNKAIPGALTTRSKWVQSSILVDKATGRDTRKMQSEVGAKKRWRRNPSDNFMGLRDAELGATLRNQSIATQASRISGLWQKNVSRPLRRDRFGNVHEISSESRMVSELRQLERTQPNKFIRIKRGGRYKKGVYRFSKKRTFTDSSGKKHKGLEMIKDESNSTVRVPRNPWLMPSVRATITTATVGRFYRRAFERYTRPRTPRNPR